MREWKIVNAAGVVIVIDRMTRRAAFKRNEAMEKMKLPYRWTPA